MRYLTIVFSRFSIIMAATILFSQCSVKNEGKDKQLTLLVVFDGLRPDYITPETMPFTSMLMDSGAVANLHHSVLPTLTRVNSAAIASGNFPGINGVMGNSVYFPSIDSSKALNTGDAEDLKRIVEQTGQNLFTSPTLSEILASKGKSLSVFSTGSTGQSFLLNHTAGKNGTIINPALIIPDTLKPWLEENFGPLPSADKKNLGRHTYITDVYIQYGLLSANAPEVSILWFADPDATAHAKGVGAPETMAAIKHVDNELGRVLQAIKNAGLEEKINLLIATDHGFVTHMGNTRLETFLIETGFKTNATSTDVVLAGGAIYVKNKSQIPAMVAALQSEEWAGAIFTKPSEKGECAQGTLPLDVVHYNHDERAPDVLIDMAWNDSVNAFGYAGASYSGGIAGHGCSSPYETAIKLIAHGPAFKKQFNSNIPSGNTDIAPTILQLQKVSQPESMEGRVLDELLAGHNVAYEIADTLIMTSAGMYTLKMHLKKISTTFYPAYSEVSR